MSFYTHVRPCDLYPYARRFYPSKWLPSYVQNPLRKLHRLPPRGSHQCRLTSGGQPKCCDVLSEPVPSAQRKDGPQSSFLTFLPPK